jgi:hypothetical protein
MITISHTNISVIDRKRLLHMLRVAIAHKKRVRKIKL